MPGKLASYLTSCELFFVLVGLLSSQTTKTRDANELNSPHHREREKRDTSTGSVLISEYKELLHLIYVSLRSCFSITHKKKQF